MFNFILYVLAFICIGSGVLFFILLLALGFDLIGTYEQDIIVAKLTCSCLFLSIITFILSSLTEIEMFLSALIAIIILALFCVIVVKIIKKGDE